MIFFTILIFLFIFKIVKYTCTVVHSLYRFLKSKITYLNVEYHQYNSDSEIRDSKRNRKFYK